MHRIRLRGPWTKTLGGSSDPLRTSVPEIAADADHRLDSAQTCLKGDAVVYERRFNRPTGLEPGTLVLLNIQTWIGQAIEISVNGHSLLIGEAPFEADITQCLESHNCLRILLAGSPAVSGSTAALPCLTGDVSLMIRDVSD